MTFDENRPCAKCGGTSITTFYGQIVRGWTIKGGPNGDVLTRRCDRCKFEWIEEPLDKAGTA